MLQGIRLQLVGPTAKLFALCATECRCAEQLASLVSGVRVTIMALLCLLALTFAM